MSKFLERAAEERKNLKKRAFSMNSFLELMTCYINEPEFESHVMKVVNGKAVKELSYPVKAFRKVIMNVLVDFGVDAKEAESIISTYQFKSKDLEGIYEFMTDFMYQYMKTGRVMKLFDKDDVSASIFLKDMEEKISEVKIPKTGDTKKIKYDKHSKLGVKSTCSKWNKSVVGADGEAIRVMEKVAAKL